MNIDHYKVRASRVIRLAATTAVFATACGFPDSLSALFSALQVLLVG